METYAGTNKAEEWRIHVKDFFEKNNDDYKVINPTDYYQYGKNYHKTDKEVFRFDIRKVSHSDIILVNLKDIRKSIGSCIEIYEAYKNNIPVIGFLDDELSVEEIVQLIHPWIYCCVDRIETGKNSLDKAIKYIMDYYR